MTPPLPDNLWFPVAPGTTDLPSAPAVTNQTPVPANSIATPAGFNPDAPGDIWALLPSGQEAVFANTLAPTTLLLPYSEEIKAIALVRPRLVARSYPYALTAASSEVLLELGPDIQVEAIDLIKVTLPTTTSAFVVESGGPAPADLEIVASNAAPLLGASAVTNESSFNDEWTVLLFDEGFVDEGMYDFAIPAWLTIGSTTYGSGSVSTNGYIEWPTNTGATYTPGPTDPAADKLIITGGDCEARAIAVTTGNNYVRVRGEFKEYGGDGTIRAVYETTFFEPKDDGTQYIEVRYGVFDGSSIDGIQDLMICDSSTAYVQTSQSANSSYVLQGNATGTSWTISSNSHVSNPNGKFVVSLPSATTRTGIELAPTATEYLEALSTYTGNETARQIDTSEFYVAAVWTHYASVIGLNAWGAQKATQVHFINNLISSDQTNSYTSFNYAGYSIGTSSRVNKAAQDYYVSVFGATGPVRTDFSGDTPVTYQKAPGMVFFYYSSSGASELSIPHQLGSTPAYIYTKRVQASDFRPRSSGSLIGVSKSLYLNQNTAVKDDTIGNYYYKGFNASTITYDQYFAAEGEYIGFAFANESGKVSSGTFSSVGLGDNVVTGLGFQPSWVLLKCLTSISDHLIFASNISGGCVLANALNPSVSTTKGSLTRDTDGFTYTGVIADSGETWMYLALA